MVLRHHPPKPTEPTVRHLTDLRTEVAVTRLIGPENPKIGALRIDSRAVETGDLFAALRGTQVDGHDYIQAAQHNGAAVILCEILPAQPAPETTYVVVENSAEALGQLAAAYYGHPSRALRLVGVTGTNGKTTTVTLLYRLFTELGYKTGLLSTIENRIGGQALPAKHTTSDAVTVQALLRDMVDAGCDYAFMEVSSHAVDQRRIAGLHFAGAVFSNITHDHLDYHKTFKAYIAAKKQFFDKLPAPAFALTNLDDRRGSVMLQNTKAAKRTYSLRRPADFKAKIIANEVTGLQLELDGHEFHTRLVGAFNAYNLLAVYAVARLLDHEPVEVLTALSRIGNVPGRFETIYAPDGSRVAVVDYAHTPDALEKVLQTLDRVRQGRGRILTVVGCGGDRDKAKRPRMAKVAADYSEQVILTSDNPRGEDPEAILRDMEAGVPGYAVNKVLTIVDRRQAIRTAAKLTQPHDLLLIAGKGHETYQEIGGKKLPFDDRAEIREAFAGLV